MYYKDVFDTILDSLRNKNILVFKKMIFNQIRITL
jgi:hypothetical protein